MSSYYSSECGTGGRGEVLLSVIAMFYNNLHMWTALESYRPRNGIP